MVPLEQDGTETRYTALLLPEGPSSLTPPLGQSRIKMKTIMSENSKQKWTKECHWGVFQKEARCARGIHSVLWPHHPKLIVLT